MSYCYTKTRLYYNVICFSDCRQLKKAHVIKFQDLYVTTVHGNLVTHTSQHFIHLSMLYVPCVLSYKNKGFLSRGVDTGNHGIEIFQHSYRGKALHSLHIDLFLNNLISNWFKALFCSTKQGSETCALTKQSKNTS